MREKARQATWRSGFVLDAATFVGRATDLALIATRFRTGHRAITILGTGGAGKTRLGLEHARLHEGEYSGGIYFCDLAETRDVGGFLEALSRTLGLAPTTDDQAKVISRALGGRGPSLLILDNVEQIVEVVSSAVDAWLCDISNLRILSTSRERIGHREEAALPLEPLSLPDREEQNVEAIRGCEAVSLFVDRAQLVDPTFVLSSSNARDVVEIVWGLDGIPLAIELCAARVGVLGLHQLRSFLGQRLDLLADRGRSRPPRHQTLRATMDWSWSLLTPREQLALAQCSVFQNGFSLSSAQAVLASSGATNLEVIEVLQALHDKSLIRTSQSKGNTGERRYALYQAILDYARERLNETENEVQLRHAKYFASVGKHWVESLRGHRDAELQWKVEEDVENLLAASDFLVANPSGEGNVESAAECLITAESFFVRTSPTRFLQRMKVVLAALSSQSIQGDVRARAQAAQGNILARSERWDEASESFLAAVTAGLDNPIIAARGYALLGFIAIWRNSDDDAVRYLDEADRLSRGADAAVEGLVARYRGIRLRRRNEIEKARAELERALTLSRQTGSHRDEGQVLGSLGNLSLQLGEVTEARALYERAVSALSQADDDASLIIQLVSLGSALQELGKFDEARRAFEQAGSIERSIGAWSRSAAQFGALALEEGHYEEAISFFRDHTARIEQLGSTPLLVNALAYSAAAYALAAKLSEAIQSFDRAETLSSEKGGGDLVVLGLFRSQLAIARAKAAASLGHDDEASRMLEQARRQARAHSRSLSDDGRFALRLLNAEIERVEKSGADWVIPADSLVIERNGGWFRTPSGPRIDVVQFRASARILSLLAKQRIEKTSAGVGADALIRAAWPDERIVHEAAMGRLQSAISRLRKLGLETIRHRRNAYFLDTELPVRIVDDPDEAPRSKR